MISVDTNVIVRLLIGDDQAQFKRAKALFSKENIIIATTIILECEWVLRYAYHFEQKKITNAFQALFGLSNIQLQDPLVIADAMEWHQNGMDFADAIHLAQSKESEAFVTFDKKFIKSALKTTTILVREP
jgi:predicted nucleic-acid-binding protein